MQLEEMKWGERDKERNPGRKGGERQQEKRVREGERESRGRREAGRDLD